MTRTYAAKRLLEHGPLTFFEILEITRWTKKQASGAVQCLLKTKTISFKREIGNGRRTYFLSTGL